MKRSPLKRKTKLKRLARLSRVSKKRRAEAAIYGRKRKAFLFARPLCEAGVFGVCKTGSEDVHHMRGRSGSNYLNAETWLATCRPCHVWIHANPNEARALNLLK